MSSAVVEIETPELGDRSYLVHDGDVALVVDPQRDIDRVLAVAAAVGVSVTHVAETHLHNDYVSGGRQLARETGAAYLVGAGEPVAFERVPVHDGDEIAVGDLSVSVVATPGHTPGHVAYVVASDSGARFAFTGGSLLHGSVGRTDLSREGSPTGWARAQYRSVRALAAHLADDVVVHPTHGFGSFCSSGPKGGRPSGTIGEERRANEALRDEDEDRYVEALVAGFAAHPAYYDHMAPLNASGAGRADLSPPRPVPPEELRSLLASQAWVVDLRDRVAFARDHLAGSVSFEQADALATYLGWVVPWDAPLTLLATSPDRLARARLDLSRIGRERLRGAASGPLDLVGADARRASYPVSDFAGLAKERVERDPVVLDVRRDEEWRAGHIAGAAHVFVADLPGQVDGVPAGTVWAHCASGYRASIAASVLHRAGRDVVLVDDDWANAFSAGLEVVSG